LAPLSGIIPSACGFYGATNENRCEQKLILSKTWLEIGVEWGKFPLNPQFSR